MFVKDDFIPVPLMARETHTKEMRQKDTHYSYTRPSHDQRDTHTQTNRQTLTTVPLVPLMARETPTDIQTHRQTDRQTLTTVPLVPLMATETHRQTDRHTDRQTDRHLLQFHSSLS